ncbi:hypothetical protein ABIA39_008916 [Nocardia sp. GAS34]|uniref:hypothetical protein n=1 Tax=unclassified Nocardia TaxID=2637762 RepID=UPI003D1F5355
MPDEYDRIRKDLSVGERGLYFELGRAHLLGETQARGWVRQFAIKTDQGARVLDSARGDGKGVEGRERKSGQVDRIFQQVDRERSALEKSQMTRSRWETVEGEKISRSAEKDLAEMRRDFGGRFEHVVVSRADATRAIAVGRDLVQSQQLELVQPYVLERAQRARVRLEKIRELVRQKERDAQEKAAREKETREKAAREKETQEREAREKDARRIDVKNRALVRYLGLTEKAVERSREQGQPMTAAKVVEIHDRAAEGIKNVRGLERAAAERNIAGLGLDPGTAQTMADLQIAKAEEKPHRTVQMQGIDKVADKAIELHQVEVTHAEKVAEKALERDELAKYKRYLEKSREGLGRAYEAGQISANTARHHRHILDLLNTRKPPLRPGTTVEKLGRQ